MKRIVTAFLWILILSGGFITAFDVRPVTASGTIYIRANGSIDPPTADISTVDNMTYVLTGSINDSIVVERSDIVVDGNGFTLQGSGTGNGIFLDGVEHVTVRDVIIRGFGQGIYVLSSSDSIIVGNTVAECAAWGIRLAYSSRNTISCNNVTSNIYYGYPDPTGGGIEIRGGLAGRSENNRITENRITGNRASGIQVVDARFNEIYGNNITDNHTWGVRLSHSSRNRIYRNFLENQSGCVAFYVSYDNSVYDNVMMGSQAGVSLTESSHYNMIFSNHIRNNTYGVGISNPYLGYTGSNMIFGNQLEANEYGIYGTGGDANRIWHNNFIDNIEQAYVAGGSPLWDDGYPAGGNYWSNYNGTDVFRGLYQNLTGSDGIGDTAYVILDHQDNYPLMGPGSTVSPWADDDGDGILNYLDVANFAIDTGSLRQTIMGFEWAITLSRISPQASLPFMMEELRSWGVRAEDYETNVQAYVIDLGNALGAMRWLRLNVPFVVTQGLEDLVSASLCSDGHLRFLFFHHSDFNAYDAIRLLEIALKAALSGGSEALENWLDFFSDALGQIGFDIYQLEGSEFVNGRLTFNFTEAFGVDVVKNLMAYKDIAMISIKILLIIIKGAGIADLVVEVFVKALKFLIDYVAFYQLKVHNAVLDWIKMVLVAVDPPGEKVVMQLRDSASQALLLGYNASAHSDVSLFEYGFYMSDNDSATMILARSHTDYNLTVTRNVPGDPLPYSLIFWDCKKNQTITVGGFLDSNQTASSHIGLVDDELTLSRLTIQADVSTLTPRVGEEVTVNATVTDDTETPVDNLTVGLLVADQLILAQHVGNGTYQAALDTAALFGFYNVTLCTLTAPPGYLQGMAAVPLRVGRADVTVSSLDCRKTVIGQGCTTAVNATVANHGDFTETFYVLLNVNGTLMEQRPVASLEPGNSRTIALELNTASLAMGSYAVTGSFTGIPGDVNMSDNALTLWLFVTIPGDADGNRKVDIFDIVRMASIYGVKCPDPRYDPNCDIDGDGDVDIFDVVIAAGNYGDSW